MACSDDRYDRLLQLRKTQGTFRSLKRHETRQSSRDELSDVGKLIDFSSNDYLSLTHSPAVRQRFLTRLEAIPSSSSIFGSTGSRLLDGSTPHHTSLENRLATFFSSPSALLFNSGWDANVSFFGAIPQRGDWIVYDELVHASVWDGMRAGERRGVRISERKSFKHNNLKDLERVLMDIIERIQAAPTGATQPPMIYLALESLYSMDGDLAPLPGIVKLLKRLSKSHPKTFSKSNVWIILDEAHTTGAYGTKGRGYLDAVIMEEQSQLGQGKGKERQDESASTVEREMMDWVKVRVMTFGKAVGGQGAVLLSSETIRSFLINYARPFIFSTAMSVSNVIAIESAFDVLESEEGDERRLQLQTISTHALSRIQNLLAKHRIPPTLLSLLPPPSSTLTATSILPLITPQPHSLANHLRSRGFLVRPIVHPTVPKGKERVRICLHSGNREGDVDLLVESVGEWAIERMKEEGKTFVKSKL